LIDYFFLTIEFIHHQTNYFTESCGRFELPSFDLQSNAYSHVCQQDVAENKGFEPLHRMTGDGLANHYITTLSTLQNIFADEERFEHSSIVCLNWDFKRLMRLKRL
jgi:hypothetical protein